MTTINILIDQQQKKDITMKNIQLKLSAKFDAHIRSQIPTLILNPINQYQIISIGYDSYIRAWHHSDLTLSKSIRIISPYLTSIVAINHKFIAGIGNGRLILLNDNLQIQKQIPVHKDCITSIIILPEYIITASIDGYINFLNRQNFAVEKTIYIGNPIWQCLPFQNNLYISANPSLKINLSTHQQQQIGNYHHFIIHKNNIFCCSDQEGITCLTDNQIYHIPCNFIMSIGQYILMTNEQDIGIFSFDHCGQSSWKMYTMGQLTRGCAILSGVCLGDFVFLAGESGEIYKIQVIYENKEIL